MHPHTLAIRVLMKAEERGWVHTDTEGPDPMPDNRLVMTYWLEKLEDGRTRRMRIEEIYSKGT